PQITLKPYRFMNIHKARFLGWVEKLEPVPLCLIIYNWMPLWSMYIPDKQVVQKMDLHCLFHRLCPPCFRQVINLKNSYSLKNRNSLLIAGYRLLKMRLFHQKKKQQVTRF